MTAIARRYARAGVEAAHESGGAAAVEALADGLRHFSAAFLDSEELRELLNNPALEQERSRVLELVLEKLDVSKEVRGLVRLLSGLGRVGILEAVAAEVEEAADELAGRARAHVTSAIALTDSQKQRIAKALEGRLGRKVVVSVHVDSQLLGGLVCQVGDLTLDSSLRRQLEVLREQLEKRDS